MRSLGDEAEEWRLFQLHRQPLAKRPVKHGVAGRVCEIGEDNGVLVREFWRAVKIEVACGEERQHSRGGGNRLPVFCGSGLVPARLSPGRIRVPLQALQVGANLRSVLVAQVAILLQALVDDALQLRGSSGFSRTGGTGAR